MTQTQYEQLVRNARATKTIRVTRRESAAGRSYHDRELTLGDRLDSLLRSAERAVTLRERALIELMRVCPGDLAWQVGIAGVARGVVTVAVSDQGVARRLRPLADQLRRAMQARVTFAVAPDCLRRPAHGGPPPAARRRSPPPEPPRTRIVGRRRVPAATALF